MSLWRLEADYNHIQQFRSPWFVSYLHRGARQNLGRIFTKAYPVDVARLLSILGGAERWQAFSVLRDECEVSSMWPGVLSEMEADDSVSLLETA